MTAILDDIAARRLAGRPLDAADADALAASYDIVTLGMIADEVRRARHGRTTTFVRVADLRLPLVEGAASAWPRGGPRAAPRRELPGHRGGDRHDPPRGDGRGRGARDRLLARRSRAVRRDRPIA